MDIGNERKKSVNKRCTREIALDKLAPVIEYCKYNIYEHFKTQNQIKTIILDELDKISFLAKIVHC
jgi:hypothetical protein